MEYFEATVARDQKCKGCENLITAGSPCFTRGAASSGIRWKLERGIICPTCKEAIEEASAKRAEKLSNANPNTYCKICLTDLTENEIEFYQSGFLSLLSQMLGKVDDRTKPVVLGGRLCSKHLVSELAECAQELNRVFSVKADDGKMHETESCDVCSRRLIVEEARDSWFECVQGSSPPTRENQRHDIPVQWVCNRCFRREIQHRIYFVGSSLHDLVTPRVHRTIWDLLPGRRWISG